MRIGPDTYYNCPGCGEVIYRGSISSGNTFGGVLYSDSRMIAKMLPKLPTISKCKHCNTIFWVNKQKEIDYVYPDKTHLGNDFKDIFYKVECTDPKDEFFTGVIYDEELRHTKLELTEEYLAWEIKNKEYQDKKVKRDPNEKLPEKICSLDIDDYFKALQKGIAENQEEEKTIRLSIWWAYNDRIRYKKKIFNSRLDKKRWIDNVKKLIAIIEQSDIQQKIMLAELYRNLGKFRISKKILQTIDDEKYNWIRNILIKECKSWNRWVVSLVKPNVT